VIELPWTNVYKSFFKFSKPFTEPSLSKASPLIGLNIRILERPAVRQPALQQRFTQTAPCRDEFRVDRTDPRLNPAATSHQIGCLPQVTLHHDRLIA
jgi:hypothetical protein